MNFVDILGYVAGFLTLFNMLPQVVKSYQTKSVNDISFLLVISYALSMLLWVLYAYFIVSWPIMITNGVAFFVSLTQLILMIRYNRSK